MPKHPMKLRVRLPKYRYPRNAWRSKIRSAVREEMQDKGIHYTPKDKLEIYLRLYFDEPKLHMSDVDNRLKDVMDTLQGRFGKRVKAIIPNDSQIYRVTVEKGLPPGQSHERGHLTIKRYEGPIYRS